VVHLGTDEIDQVIIITEWFKSKYFFVCVFSGVGGKVLDRWKRQIPDEELLNLSPEELCKDRQSEEYFRLTTEGDCRDVVRYYCLVFQASFIVQLLSQHDLCKIICRSSYILA